MTRWEMRKAEQEITETGEMVAILREARYVTVAMCADDEPYLVSLSHGYDVERNAIYFHCAHEGRKIDVLRSNPVVWGQAVRDQGAEAEECRHRYATTQFRGRVTFVQDPEEKRHAISVLIGQFGADVERFFAKEDAESRVQGVNIGRIDIDYLSGKRSSD